MKLKLLPAFLALALTVLVGLLPTILYAQESELGPREYHHVESTHATPSNESLEDDEMVMDEEEKNSSRTASNNFASRDSIPGKVQMNTNKHLKTKNGNDPQRSLTEQKSIEKNNEDEEKEDSVLSFNFLYYIFQKFKLSDIVDK